MKEGTRVTHPTHGEGTVIRVEDEFTAVVEYDTTTPWGKVIEQSICNLKIIGVQK